MLHRILINWYRIIEQKLLLNDYSIFGAVICVVIITYLAHIYVCCIEPKIVTKLKRAFL